MATKSEKKRKNDNKTTNQKSANPITLDVDPDMKKPTKGLPRIWIKLKLVKFLFLRYHIKNN